ASVVVASPVREIIASYATSLMKSGEFRVGSERFRVIGVKADDPRVEGGQIEVRSLSPVVAYSTMLRLDGRKYTCYFQPGESDFERLVAESLARIYTAVYGRASGAPVQIGV